LEKAHCLHQEQGAAVSADTSSELTFFESFEE
jgi:hypothetical protein